jgi:nucleoside 2-deoxyribosyltransferase
MTYAAEGIEAACVRVDKEQFSGEIPAKLKQMLQESIAVIADLSEARPNVLYELGFAHALNKAVIHICSSPLEELPFDVRNWSTLSYALGRTHEFRNQLRTSGSNLTLGARA